MALCGSLHALGQLANGALEVSAILGQVVHAHGDGLELLGAIWGQ